jgi:hypothetical protein
LLLLELPNKYSVGLVEVMFKDDIDYISKKVNINIDVLKEKFNQYGAFEENNCYYFTNKEKAIDFIDEMNLILKLTSKGD